MDDRLGVEDFARICRAAAQMFEQGEIKSAIECLDKMLFVADSYLTPESDSGVDRESEEQIIRKLEGEMKNGIWPVQNSNWRYRKRHQ